MLFLIIILFILIGREMAYSVKDGADIRGLHPMMWQVLPQIETIFMHHSDGVPMIITSGLDALERHGGGDRGRTLHDDGLAVDVRTRNLAPGNAEEIHEALNIKMGGLGIQAVLELTHIHIEREGIV